MLHPSVEKSPKTVTAAERRYVAALSPLARLKYLRERVAITPLEHGVMARRGGSFCAIGLAAALEGYTKSQLLGIGLMGPDIAAHHAAMQELAGFYGLDGSLVEEFRELMYANDGALDCLRSGTVVRRLDHIIRYVEEDF